MKRDRGRRLSRRALSGRPHVETCSYSTMSPRADRISNLALLGAVRFTASGKGGREIYRPCAGVLVPAWASSPVSAFAAKQLMAEDDASRP